jgi:hypothetical protein
MKCCSTRSNAAPLPSRSPLSPRWMKPRVDAFARCVHCPSPHGTHQLPPGHPRSVARLPGVQRRPPSESALPPDGLGSDAGPPPLVPGADGGHCRAGAGGAGAAEAEDALRTALRLGTALGRSATRPGTRGNRWTTSPTARTPSPHSSGPLGAPLPARPRQSPPARSPHAHPPGRFHRVRPPGDLGAALVGRRLLYRWPDECWQRGTVARLCQRCAFSHIMMVPIHGRRRRCTARPIRRLTPLRMGPGGCASPGPRPPGLSDPCGPAILGPGFVCGLWLITSRAPGSGSGWIPGRIMRRVFGCLQM